MVIPDSVTNIGGTAFSGCYSLTSIVIPDSVTSIGSTAFNNCFSLTSVVYEDRAAMPSAYTAFFASTGHAPYIIDCSDFTQVPTVTANFFTNMPAYVRILVPSALATEWKAATNWATYASQIVGVS